ncbi:MAG: hypothetical protein A2V63_10245 [Candidatus Eisenbacteria bacterium RBG_19FT_COMBO_70_11]|nr:MAG: hypothetical protein A2V63_10245 [Candidatus Eisenbacteria bacterium RBG_19FT_COMBO_70_11]
MEAQNLDRGGIEPRAPLELDLQRRACVVLEGHVAERFRDPAARRRQRHGERLSDALPRPWIAGREQGRGRCEGSIRIAARERGLERLARFPRAQRQTLEMRAQARLESCQPAQVEVRRAHGDPSARPQDLGFFQVFFEDVEKHVRLSSARSSIP